MLKIYGLKKIRGKEYLKCETCDDGDCSGYAFVISKELKVECAYCGSEKGQVNNLDISFTKHYKRLKFDKKHEVMKCSKCYGDHDFFLYQSMKSVSIHCDGCQCMIDELFNTESVN